MSKLSAKFWFQHEQVFEPHVFGSYIKTIQSSFEESLSDQINKLKQLFGYFISLKHFCT